MGLQQQSELVRAHREFFRNINYSSPSLQNRHLGSQYSTKPPGSLSPNQNCCSLVTPKPFGPLFQTRRSHKFPENHVAFISPVMKYTVTDYRLLPQIHTPPRTLGPDLSSDDYKQKWTKYQRQRGYSELLRAHTQRQHAKHNGEPLRPPTRRDGSKPPLIQDVASSSPHDRKHLRSNVPIVAHSLINKDDQSLRSDTPKVDTTGMCGERLVNESDHTDTEVLRLKAARKRET
ncbi:unnamed protein product, partial [Dicrocoelium dendriticum]